MGNWQDQLGDFLGKSEGRSRAQIEGSELARFIGDVAAPAFAQLRPELEKHDRKVIIRQAEASAAIIVNYRGEEEFSYRLQGRSFPNTVLPFAEIRFRERKGLRLIRAESMIRSGPPDYTMADITADEVIGNFLEHYMRRVRPDRTET